MILVPLVFTGLGHSTPVLILAWIGSRSYSIYLWHLTAGSLAIWLCATVLHQPAKSPLAFVLYVTGSVLLGALMAWLVEIPVLRVRDRLFPSRSL